MSKLYAFCAPGQPLVLLAYIQSRPRSYFDVAHYTRAALSSPPPQYTTMVHILTSNQGLVL